MFFEHQFSLLSEGSCHVTPRTGVMAAKNSVLSQE